jgi:H+/Cl- antiporter ClcA
MEWRHVLGVAYALVTAAFVYASQFSISPPGVLNDIWSGSALGWVWVAATFGVAFAIGRWWVLLFPLAPLGVLVYLQVIGHQSPWHDAGPPLDPLALFWLVALEALLGFALGMRVAWDSRGGGPSAVQGDPRGIGRRVDQP